MIDGTTYISNSNYDTLEHDQQSVSIVLNYPQRTFQLEPGTHTIYTRTYISLSGPNVVPTSNSALDIVVAIGSGTITISYPALITEIGSNGFRVMLSSDRMTQFTVDNGSANIILRSANYGIWITDGAMKFMLGNSNVWKTAELATDSTIGSYIKLT